jgi:transcription elongation factor GreA
MGRNRRWRPRAATAVREPTADIWLTADTITRLTAELHERESTRRHEIAARMASARESGNLRDENDDQAVHYEHDLNEARIDYLSDVLARARTPATATDRATPGVVVTVTFLDTERPMTFLLGSREEAAQAAVDVVSPASPMGAAVGGAKVGDEVTYTTPTGRRRVLRITNLQPC